MSHSESNRNKTPASRVLYFLYLYDVGRPGSLIAFNDVKGHLITFDQGFVPVAFYGAEMHKNVTTVFTGNKSVALGLVEPLYCTFCH